MGVVLLVAVLGATAASAPAAAQGGSADREAVARELRARGHSSASLDALRVRSVHPGLSGVRHVRLGQEIGGLEVHGAQAKAALDRDGRVVHLIDDVAEISGPLQPALITAAEAEAAAGGGTAKPVAIARASSVREGFLVETWDADGLRYTLVDRDGVVLEVEDRTNDDAYNVFEIDPAKSPQAIVSGPGSTDASPAGWLGAELQRSTHITGNNARAYLDADANNAADGGGTAVSDGQFLTTADLSVPPSTASNSQVAVQNLFYLNNRVHDVLYEHGFTEAAGNFQVDNFQRGGSGNDPVLAEAQDGSGTDNANFSTPADGSSPRMQMFLWNGPGATHEVAVGSATYGATGAGFGPRLDTTGLSAPMALYDDGTGPDPNDGCERASVSLRDRIALVNRGSCTFVAKVRNAQRARAVGVIVINNVPAAPFSMGGRGGGIKIPSVMVSMSDGHALRSSVVPLATMRLREIQPLMVDSSLDSDIVFHEYGHGLTWRMIGGMSGPLAGAVGEGASDALAMLINSDDVIGEYSAGPGGVRRSPYDGYPRTYGDVAGQSVHDDGEIYAAIMWRLMELFGERRSHLLDLWVGGMNFTPAGPAFEDMRDGMLAAALDPADECLIWQAFAEFGVGVGANGSVQGTRVVITESSDLPTSC